MIEQSVEIIENLLKFQYRYLGYGKYACNSCGAHKYIDYGDHEQPSKETVEECSHRCPWWKAREYLDNAKREKKS